MQKPGDLGKASSFSRKTLEDWQGKAPSEIGMMTADQNILVHGKDMLNWLVHNIDLCQNLHFFIRKEIPSPQVTTVLKSIIMALNLPDIRVWPIGAVGLSGAAGTTCGAGLAAGILGFEGTVFGTFAIEGACQLLEEAQFALERGITLELFLDQWLKSGKIAFGFGRPVFSSDERIPVVLKIARENGLGNGEWLRLALEMEKILRARKGLIMNFGCLLSALLMEIGYTRAEILVLSNFFPLINFLGVFHEYSKQRVPIFSLSCKDIEYSGPSPRMRKKK